MMAGTDALAQGIAGGVGNLSRALEDITKKKKAEASLANVLRKKHSLTQPDRKDEFATMGLDELRGEDEAFTVKNMLAREEQAAAQRQQQIDLMLRKAAMDDAQARAGAMAMSRLGEMGQDPESIPAPFNDAEFSRRTRQPSLSDVMSELGNAGMATGGGMDPRAALELSQAIAAQSKGQGMLGPEALKQFGFVPTGGQVNPNGSASINFGPPDPQYPATAEPILTKDGQPTGKAKFEGKTIDLSPPNAEGKTLTQSENQMLGALNQAGSDLDNLDKIFKKLGKDWGGPVAGRAMNAAGMGQNPDIVAVENAINAATPNLARGVFREVGVLTDEDIRRYKALLPTAYDTDAVRSVKMKQLRERIEQGKKETMDSLRKAGRDLSGFDKAAKAEATNPPPNAAGKTHAQLIDEANAAIQAGADETKVRARLKELGVQLK